MNFQIQFDKLKNLNLPTDKFIIIGSGSLSVRKIRDSKDVDMLVTEDLWNELIKKYPVNKNHQGVKSLEVDSDIEIIDPKSSIYGNSDIVPLVEMFEKADVFENIKFINLDHLRKIKLRLGREKDLKDITLIDVFIREEKIKKMLHITVDRMFMALEEFHIWKKMNEMMNIHEVGQEKAEKNVDTFKKYWSFFQPVLSSTYKSFVTDLAIFFDAEKYKESFSLNKLLNLIKEKISQTKYTNLFKKIESIKKRHGVKIGLILELRNAEVSHQEIERKSRLIHYKDIDELFLGVQEVLNLISKVNDDSFTIWEHVGKDASSGLEWVIETLELGEKKRTEEFNKKWNVSQ